MNSAKPLFSQTRITRQRPQRREVHGLDEDAGLDGAVAEEHDRDLVAAAEPRRQRATERERDVPAHDARRAHEAVLDVDEVHRAAETAAEAAVAAHQLGHDALERRALRDRVAVRAVAAVDGVVVAQLPADADRHRLLADAQVHEAVHLVGALSSPTRSSKTRIRHIARSRIEADAPPSSAVALCAARPRRARRRAPAAPRRRSSSSSGRRYCLHRLAVGDRRVQRRHELDRRLQRREASRRHLAAITAAAEACRGRLVDQHEPAGLLDRLEDRGGVERRERARVDHLGARPPRRRAARQRRAPCRPSSRCRRSSRRRPRGGPPPRRTARRARPPARRRARASAGSCGRRRPGCRRGSPSAIRPLASAAVDGTTTLRPGTPMNIP